MRGGPGTRGALGPSWGRGSAGWETGDGGTDGSCVAAVSAASGADVVPVAAAPSGAAARSAEPLAVPLGTVVGAAVIAAPASRAPCGAGTAPAPGRGLAPPAGAPSRGAAWPPGLGLEP